MNPTGRIVREWRDGLKLSQSQFARLADVHPMTVSRWERGADVPLSAVAMYKLRKLHEKMQAQQPVQVTKEDEQLLHDALVSSSELVEVIDSEPMLPGIVAEETVE